MHYLQLRMDHHAQKEIRDYAWAIYELVTPICPITMEAFFNYRFNSLTLSGAEIEHIRNMIKDVNDVEIDMKAGEKREFVAKLKRLNLIKEKEDETSDIQNKSS